MDFFEFRDLLKTVNHVFIAVPFQRGKSKVYVKVQKIDIREALAELNPNASVSVPIRIEHEDYVGNTMFIG